MANCQVTGQMSDFDAGDNIVLYMGAGMSSHAKREIGVHKYRPSERREIQSIHYPREWYRPCNAGAACSY